MKKYTLLLTTILILAMAVSFTACGGDTEDQDGTTAMWPDEYVALLESGEETAFPNYDALLEPMQDYQTETESKYTYCVMPADPNNLDGDYVLTLDASVEPDAWGTNYGYEIQFKEAAEGEVSAARSAWEDGDSWCWSTFAPVKDADGEVVAIVGIDYPADIVADYPEWDRDSDEWNGEEGAWPTDMPADLQTFVDECKDRVAALALQLSTQQIQIQQ